MNTVSSPGISTALLILFNLLYFVLIMLLTSLFIERVWIGRSRWIILPLVGFSLVIFALHPGLFLRMLEVVTGSFSFRGLLTITGFGSLAGMVMSSLWLIIRLPGAIADHFFRTRSSSGWTLMWKFNYTSPKYFIFPWGNVRSIQSLAASITKLGLRNWPSGPLL